MSVHLRAAALAAAALLAACGSSPSGAAPASQGAVARVGSQQIPRSLFDLRLASALTAIEQGGGPQQGSSGYDAMVAKLRASVLKSLIIDSVIAQEDQFRHIAASDADVEKEVGADARSAGGTPALQTQLAEAGGSLDQLRDEIRSRINEERLEDAFARERAAAVLLQLRQGADFATLARQLSDDTTSRDKGGDMGVLSDATLNAGDKAFAAGVRALQGGQLVATAVRDDAGYELLRVDAVSARGRAVHRILVAAPRPYTVKERPDWFLQSLLDAIAQYCAQGRLTVLIASEEQPCVSASPSPSPSSTPTSSPR
jgi:parvulin-like peptidyl-prolyl isomerase